MTLEHIVESPSFSFTLNGKVVDDLPSLSL